MSTRELHLHEGDKGVKINVVTPSTPTTPLRGASFLSHSPPTSPIRRVSIGDGDKGAQFKEHMDNFAQSNRSKNLEKLADVGGSNRRLSAPMDDIVKVQIDSSLALNVSQIAFKHPGRQTPSAWTNEIVNRLNAKYAFGLDPSNYCLVDNKSAPLEKDALFDGAGLAGTILALAARYNKEEAAATLRAIEKAASAVRAAKALKAEKQKEMQMRQNSNFALLQDVKKTVKDKEEAEKAATLEAKRAALAAERKAAVEAGDAEESRAKAISRMATVKFDALKASVIRQGRHVRVGSKLMFTSVLLPPKNAPPVLTVDWALVSAKMPTGKDAESNKLREQLFKLFDTARTGRLTLEQTQKGVLDVLLFGEVLPPQVVKLAFAAAAAFNKDGARLNVRFKKLNVTGKNAVVVDWVRFRMLLVYLRQYLELFVLFDTINVTRDGRVNEGEFMRAQPLLEQYGFKLNDLGRAFHEIKSSSNQGVKFKDFAHWGLTKNLRLEDHDTRRSEFGEEKSAEVKEEEAKAQALKLLQFKELMDAKAHNLKTGRIVARPHRSWGKNTLERALATPIPFGLLEGQMPSDATTFFTPLPPEVVPEPPKAAEPSIAAKPGPEAAVEDDVIVEPDDDDEENIEAEKKLLLEEEPERLGEYAQYELEVVETVKKPAAKGILLSGPSVHKSKLQVTDEVRYMPNCMFEQEELDHEQEEAEKAKEAESSDEEESQDPLPSFVESDGVPMVPCEVCVESHPAVSRCEQCEENMCAKLASAHQKSKIGKEHTLVPVLIEAKGDYCEVCEEAHAMDMKCVECDEVMCQKVAGAHKRSKIGRDHTVIPLELDVEQEREEEEKFLEVPEEKEPSPPETRGQQDLSAFKAMMDAKVQNYRAGNAIATIPTGTRLRVTARTWGTAATLAPAASSSSS